MWVWVRGGRWSHRLVGEGWQHDGLLHGVHHQLPQLLQHTLQHRLLTDLSKQRQAGRETSIEEGQKQRIKLLDKP